MQHPIVSPNEWLAARKALLAKEKEFTRARDQLSEDPARIAMGQGEQKLCLRRTERPGNAIRFVRRQESADRLSLHAWTWLGARLPELLISRRPFRRRCHPSHAPRCDICRRLHAAPFAEIEAYKKRMGWKFKWVSSFGSDFNRDFHVSFTPKEKARGKVEYNYTMTEFPSEEAPGLSAFAKNRKRGEVLHTYSSYARGLDILVGAYNFLDFAPKGRDEDGALPWTMAWVRRHDEYETMPPKAGCCS